MEGNKFTPVLVVLLIIAAFAIGSMWTKIQYLQSGVAGTATVAPQPTQAAQQQQPAAVNVTVDQLKPYFANGYIRFGDANRKLLFVEFSDPSCPFCHLAAGLNTELANSVGGGRFKPVAMGGTYQPPVIEMKKLVDQGKASYVYIYNNGHGNGELATQALYCAFEQNKFWEAHDKLMTTEGYNLINNDVKNDKANAGKLAEFLGSVIDQNFMTTCLTSGKYAQNIARDSQVAAKLIPGKGTPNFFVNAQNFEGAYSFSDMQSAVSSALN